MTFLEFFSKWNGRLVDVDNALGPQCVDLMHQYHIECLGLPDRTTLSAPTAKDVYLRAPKGVKDGDLFQKIPNFWWTVPKQGDLVFWKEPFGLYKDDKGALRYAGHVAIINEATIKRFTSFDQNFADKTGGKECRLVEHTYTGVMGFLRFKGK